MELRQIIGPSQADLRSFRANVPGGVPVWNNLESQLPGDPEKVRYICSVLSTWAYSDAPTVATVMARLGLERNRCLFFQLSNNASLIQSTGYLIQSQDGSVALLAYRGTDPFDFKTWVVNADVNPATVVWPPKAAPQPPKPSAAASSSPAQPGAGNEAGPNFLGLLTSVVQLPGRFAEGTLNIAAGALNAAEGTLSAVGGALGSAANVLGFGSLLGHVNDVEHALQSGGRFAAAFEQVLRDAHEFQGRAEPAPELVVSEARVAAGFYRNQRASWYEFAAALKRALAGQSIFNKNRPIERLNLADGKVNDSNPGRALEHLFITGHSQGAAMAQLAAFRIATDGSYAALNALLRHVYAFAPPCVGNDIFSSTFDAKLKDRVSCFLYKRDVVPHLPPRLSGALVFQHVGKFYCVDETESRPPEELYWPSVPASTAPKRSESLADLILAFSAAFGDRLDVIDSALSIVRRPEVELTLRSLILGLLKPRQYAIYDHFPQGYMTVSAPPELKYKTELGDDY